MGGHTAPPNKGMQLSRGAWTRGILSCRLGGTEAPVKVGPLAADPQCSADTWESRSTSRCRVRSRPAEWSRQEADLNPGEKRSSLIEDGLSIIAGRRSPRDRLRLGLRRPRSIDRPTSHKTSPPEFPSGCEPLPCRLGLATCWRASASTGEHPRTRPTYLNTFRSRPWLTDRHDGFTRERPNDRLQLTRGRLELGHTLLSADSPAA